MRFRPQLWAILACLAQRVTAADTVNVDPTLFDHLPARIIYLDDSSSAGALPQTAQTILWHDSAGKSTWRSTDEGKKWEPVSGVPDGESWVVFAHPYSRTTAYILSKGTKHYRSTNRGESWQSFETPQPPSLASQPLAFHSREPDWILFTGQKCDNGKESGLCTDETYYTQDGFASTPKMLIENVNKCMWAQASQYIAKDVPKELLFCIAFEPPTGDGKSSGTHSLRESRLYSTKDFFRESSFVDFGVGRDARGLVGIGAIKGFIVAALKPQSDADQSNRDEMVLYVTKNGERWERVIFPHGHGLKENAYTIVDSTKHSLMVDVLQDQSANSGILFTSNSEGTYMTRSLEYTNRNDAGIVDFEGLENIEGVAIANTIANAEAVSGRNEDKQLKTRITFDDGGEWHSLQAPEVDVNGKAIGCNVKDRDSCSLHLHSVSKLHNIGRVFSSTAPGIVMGVGSVGDHLLDYEECDTFLSTDAGLTWRMVREGAHKYEFGDQGSLLVLIDDEEPTNSIVYSTDFGHTWQTEDLGQTMRVRVLTTIPDSTALKFLIVGTLNRKDSKDNQRHVAVRVDFADMGKRKCGNSDLEKWYARAPGGDADCLMGHKLWFMRRKADADCFVMEKFRDPVGQEDNCECTRSDFECDYHFVPDGDQCVVSGRQIIPDDACRKEGDRFLGSSGYRKIPGNTCVKGKRLDEKVLRDCSEGVTAPGEVSHKIFTFPSLVVDQAYFGENSHTLLAFCADNTVWQSDNQGFQWQQIKPEEQFISMVLHPYSRTRAYLVTRSKKIFFTKTSGKDWYQVTVPMFPNNLGIPILDFHPKRPDWLIWTGSEDCTEALSPKCKAVAWASKEGGASHSWLKLGEYVRVCTWGRDTNFKINENTILCEFYPKKEGSPRQQEGSPVDLYRSTDFFSHSELVFASTIGSATIEEYMVVAVANPESSDLSLQVSMDGKTFAESRFPPNLRLSSSAYTILDSSTHAIFVHVTTHPTVGSEWGSIFKSNSNGTYYALSVDHVNRNTLGFADFEKMQGLDGIALINVVSNPEEAGLNSVKQLQTRITYNDGSRWQPLTPPLRDSLGRAYDCGTTGCNLHLHGYTERSDPRATYSSPSAVGLMLGVGNVGPSLVPYRDSDTFLTRDGGFSWHEVHKDAHMWEYGDQGTILLLVNDEDPTDRVIYSLDEGQSWKEYVFGQPIRAKSIVTMPMDTSRKFIIMGYAPSKQDASVAVHLDFTQTSKQKCDLDLANPNDDDFTLWSPSENRDEQCLFGRQTRYHRRRLDRTCFIGVEIRQPHAIERNCSCTAEDFECNFNYKRDKKGDCVLVEGAEPLPDEPNCAWDQSFWYTRTAYRKVPYSTCEGGERLDEGNMRTCPAAQRHSGFFWLTVLLAPFGLAALFAVWWTRRRGGAIRLESNGNAAHAPSFSRPVGFADTLASVPYWLSGMASSAAARFSGAFGGLRSSRRGGYRTLAVDDDAEELLHDWGDDE